MEIKKKKKLMDIREKLIKTKSIYIFVNLIIKRERERERKKKIANSCSAIINNCAIDVDITT